MKSDLTESSLIGRTALILDDQHLTFVTGSFAGAELRRIPYRLVEQLVVSQRFLTVHVVLTALASLTWAALGLLYGDTISYVIGGLLAAFFAFVAYHYASARRTTITFHYGEQTRTCRFIAAPRKMKRFLSRFTTAVQGAQNHERERRT